MLGQIAFLMTFQLLGDFLVKSLGIPFPGPLCGMGLLLAFLYLRGGPTEELRAVSGTLLDHLGLLFVPAGAAIVLYAATLAQDGVAIITALVVSTVAAIFVGGMIASAVLRQPRIRTSP